VPGLHAYAATAGIRQLKNNPDLPIIAYTANVFPEEEGDAGMNEFIGRPVESAALFKTISKWLEHPQFAIQAAI
jgi:CheY-like chemotaxis protein